MKRRNNNLQLNNAGMTLTELVVSFALLALFLVAATRLISYSINLYYVNRGETYGLEVSDMISEKVIGMLEGARSTDYPEIVAVAGGNGSTIAFRDQSHSMVTIGVDGATGVPGEGYVVIHYDELIDDNEDIAHEAVDWKFDPNAYMGYTVKTLTFTDVSEGSGSNFEGTVFRMDITLHSERYGDYESQYLIKCNNVDPSSKSSGSKPGQTP